MRFGRDTSGLEMEEPAADGDEDKRSSIYYTMRQIKSGPPTLPGQFIYILLT